MAQSHKAGDPTVTGDNPIRRLLSAPLGPGWTIEGLAEEVLSAVVGQSTPDGREFILDADAVPERQAQRLLRPLLACLATKSAAEAGIPPDLYGGRLAFRRPGPDGPVWVVGQFDNRPGTARVALRRTAIPLPNASPHSERPATTAGSPSGTTRHAG